MDEHLSNTQETFRLEMPEPPPDDPADMPPEFFKNLGSIYHRRSAGGSSSNQELSRCPRNDSSSRKQTCRLPQNTWKQSEYSKSGIVQRTSRRRNSISLGANIESAQKVFLKKLVKKSRTNRLIDNFASKIRRTAVGAPPPVIIQDTQEYFFALDSQEQTLSLEGFDLSSFWVATLNTISIILGILINVVYQLELSFPQFYHTQIQIIKSIQSVCLVFFAAEFVVNSIRKKYQNGKSLIYIKNIMGAYARSEMLVDAMALFIMTLSICGANSQTFAVLKLLLIFKLGQTPTKANAIETILSSDFVKQQYFGIITVFLVNMFSAHMLSLILNSMEALSPESNWLTFHNIQDAEWYQKYIWGLYWATAVMLTIGFGDFAATNYKEAGCLILIEMVSCMLLSYNINYVGNLISNIRRKSSEKNRNLNTFTAMAEQNQIPLDLQNRIKSHIQGSFLVMNNFNFREQNSLLDRLPEYLRREYLNEANQKIFCDLPLLKNLTTKIRSLLAQRIQRFVSHPEEIIQRCGEASRLMILQQGTVGLCTRGSSPYETGSIIQTVSTHPEDHHYGEPGHVTRLLNLCFIRPEQLSYSTKALSYCVIFALEREELIKILKHSHFDYEFYCQVRDQSDYDLSAMQLLKCGICVREHHNKFDCPRLHYAPLKEYVIWKRLKHQDKLLQGRQKCNFRRRRSAALPFPEVQSYASSYQFYISSKVLTSKTIVQQAPVTEQEKQNLERPEQSIVVRRTNNRISSGVYSAILEKLEKMTGNEGNKQEAMQLDVGYNWKHYFRAYNPRNLAVRTQKRNGPFGAVRLKSMRNDKEE